MKNRSVLILGIIIAAVFLYFVFQQGVRVGMKKSQEAKPAKAVKTVARKKPPVMPAVKKNFTSPRVAIVIDDFGYTTANLETLFSAKQPVTFSILPNLPYSAKVSDSARTRGYEVILHLPLEAHRKDVKEEPDTIKTGMSRNEVIAKLSKQISGVPGIVGVSNHMGSKATEDRALMTDIMAYIKKKNLYFFDSKTSDRSVAEDVARSLKVPTASRDIFLDNDSETSAIESQMLELRRFAFKRGRAIAICHDRKTTIKVLAKMMPELAREGIEFVPLSKMVK